MTNEKVTTFSCPHRNNSSTTFSSIIPPLPFFSCRIEKSSFIIYHFPPRTIHILISCCFSVHERCTRRSSRRRSGETRRNQLFVRRDWIDPLFWTVGHRRFHQSPTLVLFYPELGHTVTEYATDQIFIGI